MDGQTGATQCFLLLPGPQGPMAPTCCQAHLEGSPQPPTLGGLHELRGRREGWIPDGPAPGPSPFLDLGPQVTWLCPGVSRCLRSITIFIHTHSPAQGLPAPARRGR